MLFHLILFFCCVQIARFQSMNISYCSSGKQMVTLTHDQCPYGINFGKVKPYCVCVTGVYRLWMDNCAVYDGFMTSGCTTLRQRSIEVQGIRLAGNIASMTDSTAAIFGLKETDYQKWETYEIGKSMKTQTDNFYVLNGQAILVKQPGSDEKSICVERIKKPKFCRYYRNEQNDLWSFGNGEIEISVKEKCPEGSKLTEQSCYEPLTPKDSECSLTCAPTGTDGMEGQELETITQDPNDCKPPTISEVRNRTNEYLNRKLNQYAKLRQVKIAEKPNHKEVMPIRTFDLLHIMKQIGENTCSKEFVSRTFIEKAIDLFIVLHKGRDYRYTEDLSEDEHDWIRRILHDCNKNSAFIHLFGDQGDEKCEDYQKVTGVCIPNPGEEKSSCSNLALNISGDHAYFKHHYVVDTVWNLLDLVQIVCFPFFEDSYRMFHIWEQNIEKLFTREIRKLWFNPGVKDTRVYQNLLTPTAVIDMHNLEMCVEGAYAVNPVLTRLIRPPAPKKFFRRKRRSIRSSSVEIICQKEEKDFQYPC